MAQQDKEQSKATSVAANLTGAVNKHPKHDHGQNDSYDKLNGVKPRRSLCYRIFRSLVVLFLSLFVVLGGVLYYFLGTLSGARQGLELANNFIPDFIFIDTTIKSGSVLEGLQLGETLVDIKDIVAINADSLTLDYDLWQLTDGLFAVQTLEATNLGVSLYDQLFVTDPNKVDPPKDPNEPPFRLSFPVEIAIDNFHVSDFNFRSQIVDVQVDDLQSQLWARKDNVGTKNTKVDTINVHLKNLSDVASQEEQALAAAQTDKSLAIVLDGQMVKLDDVGASVDALVQAAQRGESVEVVLLDRHNQEQAAKTEQELFSSLKEGAQYYDTHHKSAPGSTRVVHDSLSLVQPGMVYSDIELFADALESALLNRMPVPTLINVRPSIADPYVSQLDYKSKVNKKNSDDFESTLLNKVDYNDPDLANYLALDKAGNAYLMAEGYHLTSGAAHNGAMEESLPNHNQVASSQSEVKDGTTTAASANQGSQTATATTAHNVTATAAASAAAAAANATGAAATATSTTTPASSYEVNNDGLSGATSVDGITRATASAVANQAKVAQSQKSQDVAAKITSGEHPKVLVKEFGSGNGVIATLPKIILPFNIEVDNFVAKKVRYYQEGFDTKQADIVINASWYGTNLKIFDITLDHEFGNLFAVGDLDFNEYFDLNFVLEGEGYKNDATHDFMQGLLYGLSGDFKVSGDLTDLKLKSTLNLGGTSNLDVHANVLSGALPISVKLETRNITYPIFGKPLVNAKAIDLQTSGNLIDGVNVSLDANISGFDFKDVVSTLRAQISYEKSHVDKFEVKGSYMNEPMQASVVGDFFYGKVIGADAKILAKVKDAGFLSPMLKGELNLDGDFVAILNQKELAKSAVSIASEPVYLEKRIPKTSVMVEDFDADTIEQRLLSQVKSGGFTKGQTTLLSSAARLAKNQDKNKANTSDDHVDANKSAIDPLVAAAADTAEEQLLSGANLVESTFHVPSSKALAAVNSGQALASVRPILKPNLLSDGVPDGPYDMLISQQEYLDAVRFVNESGDYEKCAALANGADKENCVKANKDNFLKTIFSEDLPEIMTNIRHIKGDLFINGYKANLDISDVVGDIHQGFRVELIKFTQADNVILAEGQVTGRGADLNLIIDLKDLSTLVPSVEGSVSAYVASTGNLSDLNFELSGSSPLIKTGDMRIRKLVFNSAFNMQTRAINFTALADRIRWSKSLAASRQCFIDVSGTALRHNISANCSGLAAAYINLDGSLDFVNKIYNSNLLEIYLNTESAGSLSLLNPVYVHVDYGKMEGEITPIDLKGEVGNLKVAHTTFSSGNVKSHVSLQEFNLNSLKDFMPDSIKMQVPLNVDANILVKNGDPDIKLAVQSDKGVVFSTVGAGFVYDHFTFNSHLTKSLMHNVLDINLRDGRGNIDSVVDIKDPMGRGLLSGYFKIDQFDLQTISNIGQSFSELKGFTNVDAQLGGDLSKPLITGLISSKGSAVPRYDVGQVNDFDIKLKLLGQQGELDGSIVLNGGKLDLGGNLDWSEGANGNIFAKAKSLPIFLVGYGIARADIDTQVTLGEVLDIKGNINIPKAAISVGAVGSSGVSVSSDEIVVPATGTQALMSKAPSNFKSTMDVNVGFGKDVQFKAMGMVKGRLAGGIHITKKEKEVMPRATGEINVVDGDADIYGRKFNFEQARVIFYDDITNPNLNIEVVADRDYIESDVMVGARVLGTAQSPEIKLFSKPTMSENEILSYILYGHGLDKNAINQDSNNSNMLLGLGVSGLSGIAQSIVGSFGVQDVQLGTQGSGDEMQVEVQGYINRRLRLSYGYGVFSTVGEFKVRYELVRNLYAEFVSSIDKAVDLVYSFEFD